MFWIVTFKHLKNEKNVVTTVDNRKELVELIKNCDYGCFNMLSVDAISGTYEQSDYFIKPDAEIEFGDKNG